MTDAPDFNKLPISTQERLQKVMEAVINVKPNVTRAWTVRTSDLDPNSEKAPIPRDVDDWAGTGSVILYYIRVLGNPDFIEIKNAYSKAKAKGERAYARLNKHKQHTDYFYVGSSADIRIRKRLRGHLGYGNKKIYSLHLAYWARSLPLELEFVCAKYSESAPQEVYQALEDTLWERLKPMFGRQGKR